MVPTGKTLEEVSGAGERPIAVKDYTIEIDQERDGGRPGHRGGQARSWASDSLVVASTWTDWTRS